MGGGDELATGMRRCAAWKSPGDRQETGAEAPKQLKLSQSTTQWMRPVPLTPLLLQSYLLIAKPGATSDLDQSFLINIGLVPILSQP
jgi:hypothetical protein